jgi:DNA-directed RNA polymerase beta' subunit
MDKVDWTRCVTNDILEAFDTLGIGAARTLVVQELTKIMSCDGSYVAFPHIWAVADCIVFRGFPMRFSRHGQNRVDTSILQRASFEESAEQLVNASLFCETDPLQGITPNLILGQVVPAGTGTVGVHSDLIASKGGVETLAKAATIDLDMDPSVVTSKTMEVVNSDRVDPKTGTMREWTRRVKRGRSLVDNVRLNKQIQDLSGSFGTDAETARGQSIGREWRRAL